jgi:ribosome-associated translation inhibitor RaiA
MSAPPSENVKLCYTQIPVHGWPDVVIDVVESDLYVAIDRAADRIERSVARRLKRQRKRMHCGFKRIASDDKGVENTSSNNKGKSLL